MKKEQNGHSASKSQDQKKEKIKQNNSSAKRATSNSSKKSATGIGEKTKADLLEIAKRAGVTGRHAMTKDELINAINKKID
ncbi:Rho termination factor N-terminal domain-containing protein [Sphingobacterium kitahiroshimense]|uniref:Rho termination factor N-terminal domain-containing protein n=1 Tax=Sphingobacterium kitahiroshimense TaxID=470446 RepID=UPI00320A5B84